MKILSLNTWGGRAGKEKLLNFLREQVQTVDIFCLQEIWSAPYDSYEGIHAGGLPIQHENIMVHGLPEIAEALPEFEYFFNPHFMDNYGLLMLIRKRYSVQGSGEVWVHKEKGFVPNGDIGLHARNVQYVTIKYRDIAYTIMNFHGLWNGKGKTDSEDRLEQSKKIIASLCSFEGEVVCVGDFNLLPDTESIKLLELAGLRNLITEYGVSSTRTSIYKKPEKFADYAFVSSGVEVKDFKVLPDEVSDHAPLLLEIA